MQKSLFLIAFAFLGLIAFQSCQKDADTATKTEQTTAEDILAQNDLTEMADSEIDEAIPDDLVSGSADDRGGCANITYAQPKGTWPNTITIDFGTGCTQPSGITFKGKIIVNQSAKMTTVGATRQITYENFYVEGVQVGGSRTVTNMGLNAANQPFFTKTGTETLTFPNGDTATRTINHVRTMTEGYSTTPRADNVWQVTGTDSGINRNGDAYTVTIQTALTKKFTCPWLVSGVIELTVNGKTRSLDFGDGTCEREATLTLADGTQKEVKIRRRWWKF